MTLYKFVKKINLDKKENNGQENSPIKSKPDISCGIIDLKYNKNSLKILEFGEIEFSAFKGHEALYGPGQIWGNLWQYLALFNKPIWYISSKGSSRSNDKAIDILYKVGGTRKKSFEELEKDQNFRQLCLNYEKSISKENNSRDYSGIIVIKNRSKRKDSIKNIKDFENFIILNENFTKYGENKHNCASLFNNKKLEKFRPKWCAYPCKYTPNLANKIIQDLQCDTLVIKPVNSTRGQGIIIVEKENLDIVLQKILHKNLSCKTENLSTQNNTNLTSGATLNNLALTSNLNLLSDLERFLDSDYAFWANYKEDIFLVETFEKSKSITVEKKEYDPTMRIVFVMSAINNHKNIHPETKNDSHPDKKVCAYCNLEFNIIGAYWKLPSKDLNAQGTINEKHKSKIGSNGISSAKVSTEDLESVSKILEEIIPEICEKMLE